MTTNIFVAKLHYGVTQENLKSEFEKFGKVNKVVIPIDRETGKSKGFAFVEMLDEEEAKKAIGSLDGSSFFGRQIAVKIAEDRSNSRDHNKNQEIKQKKNFENEKKSNNLDKNSNDFESDHYQTHSDSDEDDHPLFIIPEKGKPKNTNKKDTLKKREKDLLDGRNKPQKMQAYKKSGKMNRYFDLDDDF